MDYRIVGMIGTNCYLLINDSAGQCVLVDAAGEADKLSQMIEKSGCTLTAILLTHGHYDHVMAVEELRKKYGVKVYASEEEKEVLENPQYNLSAGQSYELTVKADVLHKDGEILELAGMDIEVFHTPGHTKGGACYYVSEAEMLYSGDTLFVCSVGRTDFPTGSMSQIVRSVKEKLMTLPDATKVFPGHGESTSVSYEKKYNPFCQ